MKMDGVIRFSVLGSARKLLLLGSALGGVMLSVHAEADDVRRSGTGDYSLKRTEPVSGGPRTIDVSTTSGNIAIDVTDVNVANSGTTIGAGIAATNTGAEATSIISRAVTATGTGTTYAIDARGNGGPITIASGSISTEGGSSYGIYAVPTTGPLHIVSTTIDTSGVTAHGIYVTPGPAPTTIDGGTIATSGTGSKGILVNGGTGQIVITANSVQSVAGAVDASTTAAPVAIDLGAATASGGGLTTVVNALTTSGNIAIKAGTIIAAGEDASGVAANTNSGAIAIEVGTTSAPDDAIVGRSTTGTVAINSDKLAVTGAYGYGVIAIGGGGVTVTSGTASSVSNLPIIYAYSDKGDTVVTAGTAVATRGAEAINIYAGGNATVKAGSATSIGGDGVVVNAGGIASITAGIVSASGDGRAGAFATGGTGVVLDIGSATSNGVRRFIGYSPAIEERAEAIYAKATNGAVTATIGFATATGAGTDAVRLLATGIEGSISATITGALASTSGNGLFAASSGATTITIAAGASVIGGANGLNTSGAANVITNAGAVTSNGGPAIQAAGTTTLVNTGTITGTGDIAVQFGATNDTVTLGTGSVVNGRIVGGGGIDAAVLNGAGAAAVANQTVAGFVGFDSLTVRSGYWTAPPATPSSFNSVVVTRGSTLEVVNDAAGLSVIAPGFTNSGDVVVSTAVGTAAPTLRSGTITGAGTTIFTGGGIATLGGTNVIGTAGTIVVDNGTLLLTGTQGGAVMTRPAGVFQIGNGTTAGIFTGNVTDNGTLVVAHSDDYAFAGALTGTGSVIKQGAGRLTYGNGYGFTGVTTIEGGSVRFSAPVATTTRLDIEGAGAVDLAGMTQNVAELASASPEISLNVAGVSLTDTQASDTTFAGSITGTGSFTKAGTGLLNLTGTSNYSGVTTVNGGRLAVNGSITSPVTVNAGGTLGGNGTVGSATINPGGTFAPGNSIGTTNVAGGVTFATGSIYQVEANAAGMADRINAGGAVTINGGTVQVLAMPGTYSPLTNYTIITAGSGVNGRFTGVTSSLAFLTPFLTYSGIGVTLGLARNDISFASQASSPSGLAVAEAIQARGLGDLIYNAILVKTAAGAGAAFNQLSGEIHATVPTVVIDSDRRVRDAVMDRARAASDGGLAVWLQSMDTQVHSRDQGGAANFRTDRAGLYGGLDYGVAGLRVGISGGFFDDKLRDPDVYSRADIDTELVGGSVSYAALDGRLTLDCGATHAWHHAETTRTVTAAAALNGSYLGRNTLQTTQVFGEAAYRLLDGPVTLTPFATIARDWLRANAFAESGGVAALTVTQSRRQITSGSTGIRLAGSYPVGTGGWTLQPHLSLGYLRNWGRLSMPRMESLGATGPAFTVVGDRVGRDNVDASGGLDLLAGSNVRVGLSGYTTRSIQWRDYGGRASIGVRF